MKFSKVFIILFLILLNFNKTDAQIFIYGGYQEGLHGSGGNEHWMLPKEAPDLITPTLNEQSVEIDVESSWSNPGNSFNYHLQLALSQDFAGGTVLDTIIADTLCIFNLENNTGYFWQVAAINPGGQSPWSGIGNFTTKPLTSVNDLLKQFNISVYPNPTTGESIIEYTMTKSAFVKLSLFTISGKEIEILIDGYQDIGKYNYVLTNNYLSTGTYLYRMLIEDEMIVGKVTLVE